MTQVTCRDCLHLDMHAAEVADPAAPALGIAHCSREEFRPAVFITTLGSRACPAFAHVQAQQQQVAQDQGMPAMTPRRTAIEARAELRRKGISVTQWAVANRFSPNLVFEVLGGRKKCLRGQAHEIAVRLGLKFGEICVDPAVALDAVTRKT